MAIGDILRISFERLSDEEKDDFYNSLVWLECSEEELKNEESAFDLIKVFQDVMKFKGEQVEALIAELDEIAIKQGEEEAAKDKNQNETDFKVKSSNSTKDYEELEIRYKDMKSKFKSLQKRNEEQRLRIDKMDQTIKEIEEEKLDLIKEIQNKQHQIDEESSSDVSESLRDKQEELLNSIREKNSQISQLLKDIQVIEEENETLRENTIILKDNLEEATIRLKSLTIEITNCKSLLDEKNDEINQLEKKNENLNLHLKSLMEEKEHLEKDARELVKEYEEKVDKWKEMLKGKDKLIKQLKDGQEQRNRLVLSESDASSDITEKFNFQLEILNKCVVEHKEEILQLQKKLQSATDEMEKTTKVLEEITSERNSQKKKIIHLSELITEMKIEKRNGNERCLSLQKQVEYLENVVQMKTEELNDAFKKLEENGQIDFSSNLKENSKMKTNIKYLEKEMAENVSLCNKLQGRVDRLENENCVLREKMNLAPEEEISFGGIVLRPIRQKKEIRKLKKLTQSLEEEKLNLNVEKEQLTRTVTKLSDQIIKLGKRPDKVVEMDVENCTKARITSTENFNDEKRKELIEENEALRQGLNEIMECINSKKDSPLLEIKSESLEKLMKTLDVKHVSGWYHPAMRLQAEIHSLKGGNTELRDQLRETRLEILKLKSTKDENFEEALLDEIDFSEKPRKLIQYLNNTLVSVIEEFNGKQCANLELIDAVERFQREFSIIDSQIKMLYERYRFEKSKWEGEKEVWMEEKNPLIEKVKVLEAQLEGFILSASSNDSDGKLCAELSGKLIISTRKCLFLENKGESNSKEILRLKSELKLSEENALNKIENLTLNIKELNSKCKFLDVECSIRIDPKLYQKSREKLERLTTKYRNLLEDVKQFKEEHHRNNEMLNKTVEELNNEKKELQLKLVDSLSKLSEEEVARGDKDLKNIANKLAKCEINELTERQRANHMTSLFELVKEQLQKLEEKYNENEKYCRELIGKNHKFQMQLNEFENQVIDSIDPKVLDDVQVKYSAATEFVEKLVEENKTLREKLLEFKNYNSDPYEMSVRDEEILNLKHQLVDLQSSSDEKAMVARLSSDVVLARMAENEVRRKLERAEMELRENRESYLEYQKVLDDQKAKMGGFDNVLQTKLRFLEDTIYKQRERYLGCLPLISEEQFVMHLWESLKDKQVAFVSLQNAQKIENDSITLKKQLEEKISLLDEKSIRVLFNEKYSFISNEIKNAADSRFKEEQLKQVKNRLKNVEEQCIKLEEELFYQKSDNFRKQEDEHRHNKEIETQTRSESNSSSTSISELMTNNKSSNKVLKKSMETQTVLESFGDDVNKIIEDLQDRIHKMENEIVEKESTISDMKSKSDDLDMKLNMFRTQIADKHSQITFYEKHIRDLQMKISNNGDLQKNQTNGQELLINSQKRIKELEDNLKSKEISLKEMQELVKNDRDEHSLAALRMQKEVQKLQNVIENQEKIIKELVQKNTIRDAKLDELKQQFEGKNIEKCAIENYISQVHELEKHSNELHTSLTSLSSQLQASREESVRWKSLANERLQNMDQLQKSLERRHQQEITLYKEENEKWRKEVLELQETMSEIKIEFKDYQPDLMKKLREKDEKLFDLTSTITNLRLENKKSLECVTFGQKVNELEIKNQQLTKEIEGVRRHLEQALNREKNAKEEIRTLNDQLMKRSSRCNIIKSDRSDKEQHLQKKIVTLESEIETLKTKLNEQILQNENHKLLVSDNFDKWNRKKYWQKRIEILTNKLKEKEEEAEKVKQTCSQYKILIEKLEKEKYGLENKIKNLQQQNGGNVRNDDLKRENVRLQNELENLLKKFQMQKHHSGALGAAMMQEKLEAQERKIAVLELTSKGSVEARAEIERLQSTLANLQKVNYSLEAENMEKNLDLENQGREIPQLIERIRYLENQIENSKCENSGQEQGKNDGKVIGEMEKEISTLKRLIEKLKVENKRLQSNNKEKTTSPKNSPVGCDKIKSDLIRTREEILEATEKINKLEKHLEIARNKIVILESGEQFTKLSQELARVNVELIDKTTLLEKVKVVLCAAAAKEKALLQEISILKRITLSPETQHFLMEEKLIMDEEKELLL